MQVTSLGFQTDLALRIAEGAQVTDRGDHLVIRTPDNPDHWWGNFLLLARVSGAGQVQYWLARFAAEFPDAAHVTLGVDTTGDTAVPPDVAAAGLETELASVLTGTEIGPPPHPATRAEIRPLADDADWPGPWSGRRPAMAERSWAAAPSSSWPTRPPTPSGSTAAAASRTTRPSSASSACPNSRHQ